MSDDPELPIPEAAEEDGPAPAAEHSPPAGEGLFSDVDDGLSLMTAKCNVNDGLLRLLTRDLKFTEFAREALVIVMKSVKCEAGSLLEVDHSSNTIFFRAVVGSSSDQLADFVIPMGKGIVGYVAESRQSLVVSNLSENASHLRAIQEVIGFETRNLVAVPIIVRGRVFGVLELLNRVGEDTFTKDDSELLTYVCEMLAKALEVRLMLAWALHHAGRTENRTQEAA
jgi:GAF domain-containing protein